MRKICVGDRLLPLHPSGKDGEQGNPFMLVTLEFIEAHLHAVLACQAICKVNPVDQSDLWFAMEVSISCTAHAHFVFLKIMFLG